METQIAPKTDDVDLANEVLKLPNELLINSSDVGLGIQKSGSFMNLNKREALHLYRELTKHLKSDL